MPRQAIAVVTLAISLLAVIACGGDPNVADESSIRKQYNDVIRPLLPAVSSDCWALEANGQTLLAFQRSVELAGLTESFSSEVDETIEAIQSGLDACWQEAVMPCVDPEDQAQVQRALSVARSAALYGMEGDYHYPDPDIDCKSYIWTGTITISESVHSEDEGGTYSRNVRVDMSFQEDGGRWTAQAEESSDTGWQPGCPDYRFQREMTTSADGSTYLQVSPGDGRPTMRIGAAVTSPDAAGASLALDPDGTYRLVIDFGILTGTARGVNQSRPPCATTFRSHEVEEPFSWSPPFDFIEGHVDSPDWTTISGTHTEGNTTLTWDIRREAR